MKRFVFFVVASSLFAILYLVLQVKIVDLSYELRQAYELREELSCQKQFYMSKLLAMTSPDKIDEGIVSRKICLSYASPRKVVRIDANGAHEPKIRGIWSAIFGMPQASADIIEE